MKEFFKSKKFKFLLAFVFIMLGLIIYTASVSNSFLSSAISSIFIPLQKISGEISDHASEVTANKKNVSELQSEVDKLEEELRGMRSLMVDYYDIKKQNAQYAKYYEIKQKNPSLKFMPASVIGRDPNENFYSFTIDQGSVAGVSLNDPVITENGLVGTVYSIGPNFCKVRTILSPDIKVGVIDKVNGDSGVLIGSIKLADKNRTKMAFISAQNTMKKGDILVTSGLSGIYPADLKIGEIEEIAQDKYDASLYGVVKPYENITNVKDVFIVIGFQGKGSISTQSANNKIETIGDSQDNSSTEGE